MNSKRARKWPLRRGARGIGALALMVVAGACGEPTESDELHTRLVGRAFLLDSAQGFTPVANTTVRLGFDQTEFNFYAGCNSHSGSYSLCGGDLCVEALGSTEIGCAAELHAQDQWLAAFMTAQPRLSLAGDRLILSGSAATLLFLDREVADPDRPLTGRIWHIDTLIAGDAARNIPAKLDPAVSFDDAGGMQIFTACNTGTGDYSRQGQELRLSSVVYTDRACDSSGSEDLDRHTQRVLSDGTLTAHIDAARLTLNHADVGVSATTD